MTTFPALVWLEERLDRSHIAVVKLLSALNLVTVSENRRYRLLAMVRSSISQGNHERNLRGVLHVQLPSLPSFSFFDPILEVHHAAF